ncbi:unnamed protein product [Mycena citricolor]|uniref:Uncharacterized protein n=1 Tax=Mycena citricolor TaxID=2018698 RepID=A0AAD2K830_9AGAR|nr:unnamed protein product [Mycena citricolor]
MLLYFFLLSLPSRPLAGVINVAESCRDINNCRRLYDIIWGCLTTIFACVWVSVHPNVPPPNKGWFWYLGRRLKLMCIAVVAPELMVGFALRQFLYSQAFARKYSVSLTHGFFYCAGGFVDAAHHPIVTLKQVDRPGIIDAIRRVKSSDIRDKSKGDAFSKGVVLAQCAWFTTQCIARLVQQIPVTELEVATLGFAVVNFFVWLLWWRKPLDVQEAIELEIGDGYRALRQSTDIAESPDLNVGNAALLDADQRPKTELEEDRPVRTQIALGARFSATITGFYHEDAYNPEAADFVPDFWSHAKADDMLSKDQETVFFVFLAVIATIFGAIHCAAWDADFRSSLEQKIWRGSSVVVAVVPLMILLSGFTLVLSHSESAHSPHAADTTGGSAFVALLLTSLMVYFFARVSLLVIPLSTLRALPDSAYLDVNWSSYLPHI